jgi:uncharacterized protein
MKKLVKIILTVIITSVFLLTLFACSSKQYPRPTREFYVNDYAEVLLPGTKTLIMLESDRLYEDTKDLDDGGAQVVVATMIFQNENEINEVDRTELFREWRIGKNDMGLLILLLFIEEGEEKALISAEIEIGYRMEQYITAGEAGNFIEDYLLNPEWEGSLDMGLGELYYELISLIYVEAYGYESFSYDMEDYRTYIANAEEDTASVPMGLIAYIFSPYSSIWTKIFVILPVILLGGGGFGALLLRRRGGGGSSGGYGVRRR